MSVGTVPQCGCGTLLPGQVYRKFRDSWHAGSNRCLHCGQVDTGIFDQYTGATIRTTQPMRTIDTPDLALEPQTVAHAGAMFAVLSDPAIYTYENAPPPSVEWLRTRFEKLETRRSADGSEQWLNWVIRIPSAELIGYVQATVRPDGSADIAYELASAHWGRGLASRATQAMVDELVRNYNVTRLFAIAKVANSRSIRMLERLGFAPARAEVQATRQLEPDEVLMFNDVDPA